MKMSSALTGLPRDIDMPNDNRMGWIRNLETLASGCPHYTVEYELGSECQIPGLLDYADGKLICAAMSTERRGCGMRLAKAGLPKRRERVGRVQLAVFLIGSYAFIADCACPECAGSA